MVTLRESRREKEAAKKKEEDSGCWGKVFKTNRN